MTHANPFDTLLPLVSDEKVLKDLQEASRCYKAQAYRACAVMLGLGIFSYIRSWLADLSDQKVPEAKAILAKIEGNLHQSMAYERLAIDQLRDKQLLANRDQLEALEQILRYRNKAAHPTEIYASQADIDHAVAAARDKVIGKLTPPSSLLIRALPDDMENSNYFPDRSEDGVLKFVERLLPQVLDQHRTQLVDRVNGLVTNSKTPETARKNATLFLRALVILSFEEDSDASYAWIFDAVHRTITKESMFTKERHRHLLTVLSLRPDLLLKAWPKEEGRDRLIKLISDFCRDAREDLSGPLAQEIVQFYSRLVTDLRGVDLETRRNFVDDYFMLLLNIVELCGSHPAVLESMTLDVLHNLVLGKLWGRIERVSPEGEAEVLSNLISADRSIAASSTDEVALDLIVLLSEMEFEGPMLRLREEGFARLPKIRERVRKHLMQRAPDRINELHLQEITSAPPSRSFRTLRR